MDEKTFKERASKLKEIGKVLEALPPEIRALAFPLISDYASTDSSEEAGAGHKARSHQPGQARTAPPADREGFFKAFDHDQPADNAKLLAAWLYREFGTEPFSMEEIKALATDVGVTIPERIDMTFAAARDNAKNLFARAGRGKFKPTVHGEAYLKTMYKITKGTKQRPATPK
jgi:hypothetical protein